MAEKQLEWLSTPIAESVIVGGVPTTDKQIVIVSDPNAACPFCWYRSGTGCHQHGPTPLMRRS